MARTQPPQQPPPVQRLRVHYVKQGTARFASHRDFGRALERALRRAQVPMAYSSGFHPHPRISYAGAAPTGAASQAEFIELGLREVVDPERLRDALNAALPPGFQVRRVVEASGASLMDRLQASQWQIQIPGVDAARLAAAVAELLGRERVEVARMTKNGERRFDARAAIISLSASGDEVAVVLRHTEPLVRPDDLVRALGEVAPGLLADTEPPRANRITQGPLHREQVGDAFAD